MRTLSIKVCRLPVAYCLTSLQDWDTYSSNCGKGCLLTAYSCVPLEWIALWGMILLHPLPPGNLTFSNCLMQEYKGLAHFAPIGYNPEGTIKELLPGIDWACSCNCTVAHSPSARCCVIVITRALWCLQISFLKKQVLTMCLSFPLESVFLEGKDISFFPWNNLYAANIFWVPAMA